MPDAKPTSPSPVPPLPRCALDRQPSLRLVNTESRVLSKECLDLFFLLFISIQVYLDNLDFFFFFYCLFGYKYVWICIDAAVSLMNHQVQREIHIHNYDNIFMYMHVCVEV